MKYLRMLKLKDGRDCVLRSARAGDAETELELFRSTHSQTDFLTSYPDEFTFSSQQQAEFLSRKEARPDEVEILAEVGGTVVGLGSLERIGWAEKTRPRVEFGVIVEKGYWSAGIGRALTLACLECARRAGYSQVELDVVADNTAALRLYESVGFTEYGRNPRGFRSRTGQWQELVLMRLELD